jgi:hypothetical protein
VCATFKIKQAFGCTHAETGVPFMLCVPNVVCAYGHVSCVSPATAQYDSPRPRGPLAHSMGAAMDMMSYIVLTFNYTK